MKAEIAVNGRFLRRPITGVERYATEILAHLPGTVAVIRPPSAAQGVKGHLWEQVSLPRRLPKEVTLWSPANTGPLAVTNQVLTLQDLAPLEHPEWYQPAFAWWYRFFLPILAQRVRRIVSSSEYTRQKVLARFHLTPERVRVVPGGVDKSCFYPAATRASGGIPPTGAVGQEYLLFVGSLEPRKNLPLLLSAWGEIQGHYPGVSLVIAGAGEKQNRSRVFQEVSFPKGLERVRFLGYVPEADLPRLYAEAAALVFPSLDEGFGLPALEAMASGVPVIASNAGALPEITGDAALLFDPRQAGSLSAGLDECLGSPELRRRLREKGLERASQYSWEVSAERMWEILEEAHG